MAKITQISQKAVPNGYLLIRIDYLFANFVIPMMCLVVLATHDSAVPRDAENQETFFRTSLGAKYYFKGRFVKYFRKYGIFLQGNT